MADYLESVSHTEMTGHHYYYNDQNFVILIMVINRHI